MGYRLLSALVFILAIVSLPTVALFVFTIGWMGTFGFLVDLIKGTSSMHTGWWDGVSMLLITLGCWWGLFALMYSGRNFYILGLSPMPKWLILGLLAGIGGVSCLFVMGGIVNAGGLLLLSFLLKIFPFWEGDPFVISVASVLFGGVQLVALALLLLLKAWLVKTGRMQVPPRYSLVTFVNKSDDLTSTK